jgi:hypothetical protein
MMKVVAIEVMGLLCGSGGGSGGGTIGAVCVGKSSYRDALHLARRVIRDGDTTLLELLGRRHANRTGV